MWILGVKGLTELNLNARAFFLQGQSKLFVNMRCPYQASGRKAGFDHIFYYVLEHASERIVCKNLQLFCRGFRLSLLSKINAKRIT